MAEDPNDVRKGWTPDETVTACLMCMEEFGMFRRKHHCRKCGQIFCANCSSNTAEMSESTGLKGPQRVCDSCYLILFNRDDQLDSEVMFARYQLRQSAIYQYIQPLIGMGFRKTPEKFTHLCRSEKRLNYVLTVTRVAPNSSTVATESTTKLVRMLKSFIHPFILPTVHAEFLKERQQLFVVRPYCPIGSIRDILYVKNPKNSAKEKYIGLKPECLKENLIGQYGRHILEAMIFFRNKGYPTTFIHAGNVLIETDIARVTDYENAVLGFTPQLPPHIAAKILGNPDADIDSYVFGNVVFEMAYGMPFPADPDWDIIYTLSPSRRIYDLIVSIFKDPEPPRFQTITKNPLFADLKLRIDANYFSLSQAPENHGRSMIKHATANIPVILTERCAMPFTAYVSTPGVEELIAKYANTPVRPRSVSSTSDKTRQPEGVNELYKADRREKRDSISNKGSSRKISVPGASGLASDPSSREGTPSVAKKETAPIAPSSPEPQSPRSEDDFAAKEQQESQTKASSSSSAPQQSYGFRLPPPPAPGTAHTPSSVRAQRTQSQSVVTTTATDAPKSEATSAATKTRSQSQSQSKTKASSRSTSGAANASADTSASATGAPPPPPPPPPPPAQDQQQASSSAAASKSKSSAPAGAPAAQPGRSALLDSIRNPGNMKKLKKVAKK